MIGNRPEHNLRTRLLQHTFGQITPVTQPLAQPLRTGPRYRPCTTGRIRNVFITGELHAISQMIGGVAEKAQRRLS